MPVVHKVPAAEGSLQSHQVVMPVLRGLTANPVMWLDIGMQAGYKGGRIRVLHGMLDPAGSAAVKRIDIYGTEGNDFSDKLLVGSKEPDAGGFDIPVDLQAHPEVKRLWFSLVTSDQAGPDDRIRFHCDHVVDEGKQKWKVGLEAESYVWHVGVAVRKAGDDRVHTYRIPGIIRTDRGTLLAVYDMRHTGSRDLPGDIDVGMSRSTDGGRTWEPMRVIMDMGTPHANNGVGDPAILFDPATKRLWVAALWSKGNRSIAGSLPGLSPDSTGQLVLVSSDDDGLSWTAPASITPQVKDPAWHIFFNGPGSGIAMTDGRLVFAAQYWDEARVPHSTIIHSDDHGISWKGGIRGPWANTTESQVVETAPGTLMLNMRDNRGGFRSIATTPDMGRTWQMHPSTFSALPDPVCMGSLIKARVRVRGLFRDVLLFSNPNTRKDRHHMTIKASLDAGNTWRTEDSLLVDEREGFGYSSLVDMGDGHIGILYEGVRDLYFVKYSINEIIRD